MAAFSDQINCWNSALTKTFRGVLCLLVSLVPYLPITTAGAEDVDQSKLSIATERSFKNLSVRGTQTSNKLQTKLKMTPITLKIYPKVDLIALSPKTTFPGPHEP